MRIALVHKRFAEDGGCERYVSRLARELLDLGHEVHFFGGRRADGADPRVAFHPVGGAGFPGALRLLSFARAADRAVRGGGFDIVAGFGRTFRHDVYRAGGGCHRVYRREFLGADLPAPLRFLARNAPKQWAMLRLENRCFTRGNFVRIIANSRFTRDEIIRTYGLSADEIRVVYNGVDLERFSPARREAGARLRGAIGVSPRETLLLFVGDGFERKGLGALLAALAGIAEGSRPRLWVVGGDSRRARYAALARELGLSDVDLKFFGRRPDVEAYCAAADALVLPTRYDSFSNVCLEAMAAGLPVVTTRRNGASELISPGETGFIQEDPEDAAELRRILESLGGRERLLELGGRARAAAERFTPRANAEETLRVYEEALEEKRRRGFS